MFYSRDSNPTEDQEYVHSFTSTSVLSHYSRAISGLLPTRRLLSGKPPTLALEPINSIIRNALNADSEVSSDEDEDERLVYVPIYSSITY
jgi:hypothetical protein